MIFSHQLEDKHAGRGHTESKFYEEALTPTAADILRFLRYTMEPAAGTLFMPAIRFADNIPAFSGNILELHFDKKGNNVDFAARLNAAYDKGMLTGVKQQQFMLPLMPAVFASLIEQEKTGFSSGIENIWVEYDSPFNKAPAVFFDIDRNKPFDPQAVYDCLHQIAAASGYRINAPLLQFLERIQQSGLYVVYYGLMFSRKSHSVRLTINGINSANLTVALAALGWQGNYRTLEKIKSTCLSGEQKLVVGVDFGYSLENRIGIEVFDDNQAAFIQTLYNNGHINDAHCKLLNAWRQHFILPADISARLTNLHQRPVSKLYTRLNHIKFVVDEREAITAKGYLYYCF